MIAVPRGAGDATRVVVRAHAKINLDLQVEGARADGYHLLRTLFQSLTLHDLLTIDRVEGPLTIACSHPGVPTDERNLVWRAAERLWECGGRAGPPHGVRVRITKRIPAQGGLGGGSSDAAAALVALDLLWGTRLGADRLAALAGQLGADVPFFLCGGTALGLGRGDVIHPLEALEPQHVLLVFPPFGVSTPEAFRWFDEDAAAGAARVAEDSGTAVGTGDCGGGAIRLGGLVRPVINDLQAPVARRHPEIADLCRRLRAAGAGAAAMTGSGSTVFGLFEDPAGAAAAAAALESSGWRTLVTRCAGREQARPAARLVWTRSSRIH